jgi:glycosyltransferase involved in cell wall biosynthesis
MLLAGSHHSFYRVETALDCLKLVRSRLPSARLRIAGRYVWRPSEAEALEELRAHIAQRNLQASVEIAGAYPQTQAVALLQSAHILIHTKYNDPCPRLVVESMACGLPVVYSATGGVPELVGNDAGIGVPGPLDYDRDHPPSAELLAAAVVTVAGRLADFSRAARERAVTRFDVKPWLHRHADVFQELIASGSTGAKRT